MRLYELLERVWASIVAATLAPPSFEANSDQNCLQRELFDLDWILVFCFLMLLLDQTGVKVSADGIAGDGRKHAHPDSGTNSALDLRNPRRVSGQVPLLAQTD